MDKGMEGGRTEGGRGRSEGRIERGGREGEKGVKGNGEREGGKEWLQYHFKRKLHTYVRMYTMGELKARKYAQTCTVLIHVKV